VDDGIVRGPEEALFDDRVRPLGVGEDQEPGLLHCGIDPIGIESVGLAVVEAGVREGALAPEQVRDPIVHVRVLRLDLERVAELDQRLSRLLLLDVLLSACDVFREALLRGGAGPHQGDGEQEDERATPGRVDH
jgi:hypothetical protein